MFTQMSQEEMKRRSEDGTLKDAMIRDWSIMLGNRFKMYDVLEDIKEGIIDLKKAKNLKKIRHVELTNLNDDTLNLGIKFRNDKSKERFSIIVECIELIKKYQVVDNRVKNVEKPGLFRSFSKLSNRRGLEKNLIKLILENE